MASNYPTATDLTTYLAARNITAPSNLLVHLNAAIDEWERLTGYMPFLAETSDSTSHFDPPTFTRVLDLQRGYTSITSVAVGVSDDDPTGTVLTAGKDYFAIPYNGTTIEALRFIASPGTRPRSIKVVGKKGYATFVPDDAFRAILVRAAHFAMQNLGSANLVSMKEGDISLQFQQKGGELDLWQNAIAKYTRIPVGEYGNPNL
jgi:hypothetical protein